MATGGREDRRPPPPLPAPTDSAPRADEDGPGGVDTQGRATDASSAEDWPQLSELDLQVCLADGDGAGRPAAGA